MSYTKRILCLANSWKKGGSCVAGRTFSDKEFIDWIRPISSRNTAELNESERRCDDGQEVAVLDIIDVPLVKAHPHLHQVENHQVDPSRPWKRVQRAVWANVEAAVQSPTSLWTNGEHSRNGYNDKVSPEKLSSFNASLYLIEPESLTIQVADEGYEMQRLKARARFEYEGENYILKVTDPIANHFFVQKGIGTYEVEGAVLCVSLTEAFDGYGGTYAYKLVAGVFTPTRSGDRL